MERYIIALQQLGIKNEVLLRLITQCSSTDIELIFKDAKKSVFLTNIEFADQSRIYDKVEDMDFALEYADRVLSKNQDLDIKTAIYGGEHYPYNLQKIQNPPVLIYYKGADIGENCEKAIACVGTRKPTKLSYNIINYLVPQLVEEGYTIVSGLALGSDRLAHISSLMSKGNTIAVLAHGLDQISPKKNQRIAEKIIENGGTLVSEYPIGVKPENFRYINRNRLIVGLSKGIIVGECAIKSGTMHTVEFSKEQRKPIFCTNPGDTVTTEQEGIKKLLNQGTAIEIPNGRAYDIIINKTGYGCQHEKLTLKYINEVYIQSLLFNLCDNEKIYGEFVSSINKNYIGEELIVSGAYQNLVFDSQMTLNDFKEELISICMDNKIAE